MADVLAERVTAVIKPHEQLLKDHQLVELEGPSGVAFGGLMVSHAMGLWVAAEFDRWNSAAIDQVLVLMHEDRSLMTSPHAPEWPDGHRAQREYVERHIDTFTRLCRDALDDPRSR